MTKITKGSCLCGKISYEASGELRDVTACHCTQCRKQSGHYFAATSLNKDMLEISDPDDLLKWFQASDDAARGFCPNCGSTLFWQRKGSRDISILAGSVDGPTGLKTARHIFVADKGDYYEINENEPQFAQNDSSR